VKTLTLKSTALVALLATSACTCLKSPNLDIEPVALESTYDEGIYAESPATPEIVTTYEDTNAIPANAIEVLAQPLDTVYFALNSAALNAEAQSSLQSAAAYIEQNGITSVIVEGHADERGTREYNLALGDRRAVSMKKYLTSLGVDASSIRTISYGKERPAVSGHNEAAWAENRRGVVVFN